MKPSEYHLIYKLLVKKFYEDQALIIFLLIVGCYGFLTGKEHIELAKAFTSSLSLIWIPLVFWALYAAWLLSVFYQQINMVENAFMKEIRKSKFSKRLALWLMTFHGNYLFISSYALFMLLVAFQNEFWIVFAAILLFLSLISTVSVLLMDSMLVRQYHRIKWKGSNISLPHWTFELQHLVQERPLRIFLLKILSLSILYFAIQYYQIEDFDLRFLMAVIIFNGAVHYPLISDVQMFDQRYMSYLRNLPFSLNNLYSRTVLIILLLYLPDLALWIYWIPVSISFFGILGLLSMSFLWLLFIYSICLHSPGNAERNLRTVIYTSAISFLLVLYNLPIYIFIALFGVTSYLIFKKYYPLLFDT